MKPQPTVDENDIVAQNEVGVRSSGVDDYPPNVLMSQAGEDPFFHRIEVIAGKSLFQHNNTLCRYVSLQARRRMLRIAGQSLS